MARIRSIQGTVLILILSSGACAEPRLGAGDTFGLASWNVENLFDAVTDGTEFAGYDPVNSDWDEHAYHAKLGQVVRVLEHVADADGLQILALQEIENRTVLSDLWTRVRSMGFRYGFMLDGTGGPFHNAVLSAYPITAARTHALSIPWAAPGRQILELDIVLSSDCTLVLFVNHWHSRRAGAAETEASRRVAAAVLARRIAARSTDSGVVILAAGDLNANYDDYARALEAYPTALLPVRQLHVYGGRDSIFLTDDWSRVGVHSLPEHRADGVVLYSPWKDGAGPGSYVFRNEWNTIDHVLFGNGFGPDGCVSLESFSVVAEPFMLDRHGAPRRFLRDRATGYSDHLPLVARLRLR